MRYLFMILILSACASHKESEEQIQKEDLKTLNTDDKTEIKDPKMMKTDCFIRLKPGV